MAMYDPNQLELFFGAASQAVCRVYARYRGATPAGSDAARLQVAGMLRGPICQHTPTLPANFELIDRGPGDTPLAEAIVTEPSFWTPEMPHLYEAEIELRLDGRTVLSVQRLLGVRTLGVAGNRLRLAGRNWVLRGVAVDSIDRNVLSEARAGDTALVIERPSDEVCEAASREGVLLVAELDQADRATLARLARWPAVGMVILPSTTVEPIDRPRNLLLARAGTPRNVPHPVSPPSAAPELAAWADLLVVEADDELPVLRDDLPVVARRAVTLSGNVAERRAACDRLQGDLAPAGQFAGYLV